MKNHMCIFPRITRVWFSHDILFHFDDLSWWHIKISILSHPFRGFFHDNEVTIGYPWISTIYVHYIFPRYIPTIFSLYVGSIFRCLNATVRCSIHLPGPRDGRCGCSAASRHLGRKTTDFGFGIPGDFSQKWCRTNLCFMQMEHIWYDILTYDNMTYLENITMIIYRNKIDDIWWYDISGNMIRKIPSLQLSIESVPGNGVVDDPRKRLGIEIRHAHPVQNRAIDSRRHCSTICTDTWQIGISGRGIMGGLGP